MFAFLRGNIHKVEAGKLILEVNNIGYELLISLNTYEKIKNRKQVLIHTLFIPKEDKHYLVGFESPEEKRLFEKLIKVSGVGIQTALRILSGVSIGDFFEIIQAGNASRLTKIKGVGKKTAQKIVIELQGNLPELEGKKQSASPEFLEDAKNALTTLGFSKEEAEKKLLQIRKKFPEITSVEELIKKALSA